MLKNRLSFAVSLIFALAGAAAFLLVAWPVRAAAVAEGPEVVGRHERGDRGEEGAVEERWQHQVRSTSLAKLVTADRSLREVERLAPLADGTLAVVGEPGDIAAFRRILRDPSEGDTLRHEVANCLRRSAVPGLVADCQTVLANDDEGQRFRAFAAQHLGILYTDGWENGAPEGFDRAALEPVLTRLAAEDHHLSVRREALWGLARGGAAAGRRMVAAILAEPVSGSMHDLACRLVGTMGWQDCREAVAAWTRSQDEGVAEAARRALARLQEAQP